MTAQPPQRYTLTMTTVDNWTELISSNYPSESAAKSTGLYLLANLPEVYRKYDVQPAQHQTA